MVGVIQPRLGQFSAPAAVFDDLSVLVPYDADERQIRADARQAKADHQDVPIRFELARGSAAPRLLQASRELRGDLLVLGSRRYGPLGRVLFGSVAARVAREAETPVLIAARP